MRDHAFGKEDMDDTASSFVAGSPQCDISGKQDHAGPTDTARGYSTDA